MMTVTDIIVKMKNFENELGQVLVKGDHLRCVSAIASAFDAHSSALSWINIGRTDQQKILDETKAGVLVVGTEIDFDISNEKTLLICENPKLVFSKIVSICAPRKNLSGIHPSALIDPEAQIGDGVTIGAHCVIGKVNIGANTIIEDNVTLKDKVNIGNNVVIMSGARLGNDGFGYAESKNGQKIHFPHIGGVYIADNVEIGANTCIDRGSLGDTIVSECVKIDNLVHVAHNVIIGSNTMVVASTFIGGSARIGEGVYLGASSTVRDTITVDNGSFIGMGAVVTRDVPQNETWAGVPAKKIR